MRKIPLLIRTNLKQMKKKFRKGKPQKEYLQKGPSCNSKKGRILSKHEIEPFDLTSIGLDRDLYYINILFVKSCIKQVLIKMSRTETWINRGPPTFINSHVLGYCNSILGLRAMFQKEPWLKNY
jgi:hypothetical protein